MINQRLKQFPYNESKYFAQIEEIADILEVIEAMAKHRGEHMALIAGMKE